MDKELKEKWIKALRSGEYKQGKDCLRSNDNYCCLGVLCDIIDSNSWVHDENSGLIKFNSGVRLWYTHAPYEKIDWVKQVSLMDLNDSQSKNFDEIADWIEENL